MRAVPATLQARAETETPYGGRTVSWSDVAVVWIELRPAAAVHPSTSPGEPPERLDTAEGLARSHPALVPGVRLALGDGPPWSVTALHADEPAPGRVRLFLERLL